MFEILPGDHQVFYVPLDGLSKIKLYWIIDYHSKQLTFEVHLPKEFGWFALGFSDRGNLFPADYCLLWYDWKRRAHFEVCITSQNYLIVFSLNVLVGHLE